MLSREALFDATERYLEQARRNGSVLGVMVLRLRRFREFNVHFGYEAGDRLVAAVAEMARQALRPVDQIVQIGARDFAVLLPDLHNPDHAMLAASRLVRQFEEPIALSERPVLASVAIGVALGPEHGDDADRLFRCAESAFAQALSSVDRYAVFSAADSDVNVSHEDLHEAITNNRLQLYLQPLRKLSSGKISGVEALARWNSPRWGIVDPAVFIPLAEQTGLITPLTRWSLNNTLHHCARAQRAGLDLLFSINLSPRVFPERGIVEQIVGALRIWDVAPESIILEVTETAVMDDPVLSATLLRRLRDEGMRLAIDDFGIGHSSFAYLQQIPATELKIDKSFVLDMHRDARTRQLVRSMIELGQNLGLEIVAEGVEDAQTLQDLTELGCDYAQGYFVGRPQPAADFIVAQSPQAARVPD